MGIKLRQNQRPFGGNYIYYPVPDLAYQVDFPRLEIVLEGEFVDTGAGATLVPGDVLYVPAG
ncbi:hypothetical protein ACY2EQ_12235, partial [Escherichia coli]